ncbi:MAG: DinB family protein [Gemmatimonadetes bacterium]|nr:DinB family protein [Gemmatimonadota bacterium]
MPDMSTVLAATRGAVDDLVTTADRAAAVWTVPRAPGKWSPSQVVEHVARALEESANVVAGTPSKFPTFPGFLRPLVRAVFFNRVLKNNAFPKAKTSKPFDPASGPATPAAARSRLHEAFARFDKECRARAANGQPVVSTLFGAVSVEDYVRFQEIHTRHHTRQIPGAM